MVSRVRHASVAMLLIGVVAIMLWLFWRCRHDPGIRFLPAHGSAQWITYPNPPDLLAHPITNSNGTITVFRRSMILNQQPSDSRLQVRALEQFTVRINDQPLVSTQPAAKNWKEATDYSVGSLLRSGSNQIEITVSNRSAPPLLWASLQAGDQTVDSDGAWEASCSGAVWKAAQLANQSRPLRPGNPMHEEVTWVEALRRNAAPHGIILLLALVITLVARRWMDESAWQFTPREAQRYALGGLILIWLVLFIHNANQLTVRHGFDSTSHLGYIKSIQDHHALPKADEKWEAHQPPLFYLFAAGLLEIVQWDSANPMGILLLRYMSMFFGVGQIILVFASLRLLFPAELKRPLIGTALATFLPAHIYHAHFVTNETFFALLATGVFYLGLRVVKSERFNIWWPLALGVCLGAALLSKLTAVLLVPIVFATLIIKAVEQRAAWRPWFGSIAVCAGACLLVAGWYYWPMWKAGGPWGQSRWDYGTGWWQEDGYRSAGYYLRFGESLVRPLFSGFSSFWDGIYSTLWGDGLCGGATSVDYRPPWNYGLLALGYGLALLPTLAVLGGAVFAVWNLLRRPALEWLLLLGVTMLFVPALFYFSLVAPGTSQVRASFGLMLLVPFCALFALGLNRVISLRSWPGVWVITLMIAWALNSVSVHWVPRSSAQPHLSRAKMFFDYHHFEVVAREAEQGLRRDPTKSSLRSMLADSWNQIGRTNEARELVRMARERWTNDPMAHLDMGFDLANAGRLDEALSETRAAIELAPDHMMARRELVVLLSRQNRIADAEQACREALRVSPYNSQLREWLANLQAGKAIQ